MIIVAKDDSDSFLITNNYGSVVKSAGVERAELRVLYVQDKLGVLYGLDPRTPRFSKWKINSMNHVLHKPHVEKFDMTDEYVKTYGRHTIV
jgi:hypothetical protein